MNKQTIDPATRICRWLWRIFDLALILGLAVFFTSVFAQDWLASIGITQETALVIEKITACIIIPWGFLGAAVRWR